MKQLIECLNCRNRPTCKCSTCYTDGICQYDGEKAFDEFCYSDFEPMLSLKDKFKKDGYSERLEFFIGVFKELGCEIKY